MSLTDDIIEKAAKVKESVLLQVLSKCLGRDATIDDVHRLSIVVHLQYPDREFIGFDGNMIGELCYYAACDMYGVRIGYSFESKTSID